VSIAVTTSNQVGSSRRRGRDARRTSRAQETATALGAIRPGLPGGAFNPLQPDEIERIHNTALDILENIGFGEATASGRKILTSAGAIEGADGRIRFPRSLVEDVIAGAKRNFFLFGKSPERDIHPVGKNVYFATAGAAVHVVDPMRREYRPSTLADLYDAVRVADAMENIHLIQRPLVARDLVDPLLLDVNTAYVGLVGTSKHFGTSFSDRASVEAVVPMLHAVAGSPEAWRARPFVSASCCFVVPPLKFAEDACSAMEAAVEADIPVLLLSAGQAGATSPAPLAGAVALATAEVLAGLVYVNAIKPGAVAIMGAWPFVSDLRTGAMSGGSAEQGLLSSACGQMAHYYGIPAGAPAGMTDSKLPDLQAGLERGMTAVMAGLAGVNIIYESAGMYASLLGFSPDSLVIDNDILGATLRAVRGIEVTEDNLSLDSIARVCLEGPGHFLGDEQTLNVMKSEYVYPDLGDRTSPKEWEEGGRSDLLQRAIARRQEILAAPARYHIPPDVDAQLRRMADIRLPKA